MNTVKYYRQRTSLLASRQPHAFEVVRLKIPGCQRYNTRAGSTGITQADAAMLGRGFTRRPRSIKPHRHPAQQPGYHQPTQQQLRRARQTLRRGGKTVAA